MNTYHNTDDRAYMVPDMSESAMRFKSEHRYFERCSLCGRHQPFENTIRCSDCDRPACDSCVDSEEIRLKMEDKILSDLVDIFLSYSGCCKHCSVSNLLM